jgi:trans-aconitate methyltransferase
MGTSDFDEYHENYTDLLRGQTKFFDKDDNYFAQYKVDLMRMHVAGNRARILEYGCGIGRNLRFLQTSFSEAQVYGCDISEKSLEVAVKENPSVKFFETGKPLPAEYFD